jgi:L-rhamnose-H+ transport protein
VPAIYYNFNPKEGKDTISDLFGTSWGLMVMAGLLLCVIGIIICGKAGGMKDKDLAKREDEQLHLDVIGAHGRKGSKALAY